MVGRRTPPTLETSRLLLRGWRPRDLAPHAEMAADPEVMRYLGEGRTGGRSKAGREIATHVVHWALRGYGQWALERRSDGASIGRAGLWNPPGWPGVEVGWKLARDAWGEGYATESGRAAIEWARESLDVPELISIIHRENAASVGVAERLGMDRRLETTFKGHPVYIYGISTGGGEYRGARI